MKLLSIIALTLFATPSFANEEVAAPAHPVATEQAAQKPVVKKAKAKAKAKKVKAKAKKQTQAH